MTDTVKFLKGITKKDLHIKDISQVGDNSMNSDSVTRLLHCEVPCSEIIKATVSAKAKWNKRKIPGPRVIPLGPNASSCVNFVKLLDFPELLFPHHTKRNWLKVSSMKITLA
jgi:hypothetical protein